MSRILDFAHPESAYYGRMSLTNLTSKNLRRAAAIKDRITKLQAELSRLLEGAEAESVKKRRKMSAAGRARIAAAQRARWAKVKAGKK